jgi:SpoVK/Ycf46/Vps4 family AAA+-type ATPase
MANIVHTLASYIDALRPIIYIPHFDFVKVDKIIKGVAGEEFEVLEFNNAHGYVDFETKLAKDNISLEQFLRFADDVCNKPSFLILKDVHRDLENPVVQALLQSIAIKNMHNEHFYCTVFIVSSRLNIPSEIETYITIVEIDSPNDDEIVKMITDFADKQMIDISDEVVDEMVLSFKGLSEFEITQILNLAYQSNGSIDANDKELILREKEQFIKKSGMLEIMNFKESVDDIGGLENFKKWLVRKGKIFNHLEKALKSGVDVPKGVLLVGMPGCGKSLAAKATAKLFEVPLLRLDIGKLFGKYVGESEENMRKALKTAEAVSPCVLWIDEIEKAFSGIGESSGGNSVTTRLFGTFLTWMQEKESTVFVVATANDISNLPPEFLRKGRFDELFSVDLPSREERRKIIEIHLEKRGRYNLEIDTIKLVKITEGYSGADLESIVKDAIENVYIEGRELVTTEDLINSINNTKSITDSLKEKIEHIRKSMEKIDIKPASVSD